MHSSGNGGGIIFDIFFFFFQAEDGIRDRTVTGVQTCALPISEFDVAYGEGISKTGELIDIGIEHRIIEKSGSWFSYGDVRIGQGRENAKLFLRSEERRVGKECRSWWLLGGCNGEVVDK